MAPLGHNELKQGHILCNIDKDRTKTKTTRMSACSEDTPGRLMIAHTIESYWIPSQKKTKSKLQI